MLLCHSPVNSNSLTAWKLDGSYKFAVHGRRRHSQLDGRAVYVEYQFTGISLCGGDEESVTVNGDDGRGD